MESHITETAMTSAVHINLMPHYVTVHSPHIVIVFVYIAIAMTWCSCKKGHSYNGKSDNGICYNVKAGKSYKMK